MNLRQARRAVADIVGKKQASRWWRASNPAFGFLSANDMLKKGRREAVFRFIASAHDDFKADQLAHPPTSCNTASETSDHDDQSPEPAPER